MCRSPRAARRSAGAFVHRCDAGDPLVFELLAGRGRERRVADLHRHSLPESGRDRRSPWTKDRRLAVHQFMKPDSLSGLPERAGINTPVVLRWRPHTHRPFWRLHVRCAHDLVSILVVGITAVLAAQAPVIDVKLGLWENTIVTNIGGMACPRWTRARCRRTRRRRSPRP